MLHLPANPAISIIIPTHNGAAKILNVLQSLEKQTFNDFEVVVIVGGSTDNTLEILQGQRFGFYSFRVVSQDNRGRAGNRNRGASEAGGDLLLFFDDDTRLIPGCVQMHWEHHQKYPRTVAVGNVPEDLEWMRTDFQRYKAHLSRKWVEPLQADNGRIPADKPFLTAANFSIPKELFVQLGGFDENLTDAEDFDLAVRVTQSNIPIYFLSQAIAWHDDFITCASYIRRQLQYREAHRKLRQLKPDLYQAIVQYQPAPLTPLKKLVYRLFSGRFWVKTVDNHNFLRFLPQGIRYRIYDFIITSQSTYYP